MCVDWLFIAELVVVRSRDGQRLFRRGSEVDSCAFTFTHVRCTFAVFVGTIEWVAKHIVGTVDFTSRIDPVRVGSISTVSHVAVAVTGTAFFGTHVSIRV